MKNTMILLLILLLASLPVCALAEAGNIPHTGDDYDYILLEDGTAEITRYRGRAESLEIPQEIDGYPVTSIGYHPGAVAYFADKGIEVPAK